MSNFSKLIRDEGPSFIFDHLPIEIHIWELVRADDGRIVTWQLDYANPPALKTWNIDSVDTIVGRTTDDIFGAGATEHYLPIVQAVFETGQPRTYNDYFENIDKHFRFTTIPAGEFFITTGDDITDLVREKELAEAASREFAAQVDERSVRIANIQKQLDDEEFIRKERQKIERERSKLLGVIAHELRTPSAIIKMIAENADRHEWQENRVNVLRSSLDLINTIDDMRLLITPDLDRPIRLEIFLIEDFNAGIANSVASTIASTGINLTQQNELSNEELQREYVTDVYRTRVVLSNILKNACLHSEGEHVTVKTRIVVVDSVELLEWTIEDDGNGIPADQIERLFAPGERGYTSAEGTGFGLYIAKTWVEEIGGKILYEPVKSGGSRFLIQIPLLPPDSIVDTTGHQLADETATTTIDGLISTLNILMVEDDSTLRSLGRRLLEKLGARVTVAEDGAAALKVFNSTYNLIVTDYFMPEMSGAEMTLRIREQGYDGIIIGVTAATLGEQSKELLDAGADVVLPKPLSAGIFKDALLNLSEKGRL